MLSFQRAFRASFVCIVAAMGSVIVSSFARAEESPRKIVILAGAKSHGPEGNGAHEYPRSARLLKTMLDNVESLRGKIVTEVHFDGWPKDEATLDDAATIITISDGQDGDLYSPVPWMTPERIKVIEKQMARGCGFMTFHFSTFAPDDYGAKVLEWGGGYFDWQGDDGKRGWYSAIRTLDSEAKVGSPGHPVTRGLDSSFKLRDEYYYKIRFREGDERLKPILLVPELGGGALEQTVAWAVERKDGGRGFCTTCGHFYDNWEHPQFRKLILNAIVWTAGVDVPEKGIEAKFYSDDEVKAHLAGEAKSIKVVIVTGHQYPGHVWRETTLALEDALRKDPRLDVVSIPDPEFLASEKLHDYDAMVLNYCNWERPGLSDAAKENFVKYLRDGGGLVLVHFTNGAFHYSLPKAEDSDWPEFRKICRRVWNHQASKTTKVPSGHDAYGKFHVDIADAEHPITRGLGGFDTIDELYYQQDGEEPIHVVATAKSKVTGKDEPMAFVYEYGQGRVFQSVLGHAAESIRTPGAAALFRRGAAWAAGKTPIAVSDDGAKLITPNAPPRAKQLIAGRFGTALDAATGVFVAEQRDEYTTRPFTVECWARLAKKDGYNVLIACETKSSSRHWEIFTMPQNGHFTAYLPGHSPDHVRSGVDVCDDRWHHLAMTHAVDRVELFVDGKRVAEEAVKRVREDGPTGKLAIGGVVEGGIGCSGLVDDVRLSTGLRVIDRAPDGPHAVDETTTGLWRFDKSDAGKIDDESKLKNGLSSLSIAPPANVASNGGSRKIEGHWGEDSVGFRWTEGDSVDGRWNEMDVGPFLASVLPLTKDVVVAKGLSIKVGDAQRASVGYDFQSATLRGAWTGGFLKFDPARYGVARSPLIGGELQFLAHHAAWSPGRVQYRGLHQHGRRVTLAYQVGDIAIYESPWAVEHDGRTVFTRTLRIAPHREPLTFMLSMLPEKATSRRIDDATQVVTTEVDGQLAAWSLTSSAAGVELAARDGRIELRLASNEKSITCQLAMVKLPRDKGDALAAYVRAADDPEDIDLLLRPGPSLWPEPIATQGRLGTGGPYVVDTLTIPFENPFKALMFVGGHDFFASGDIAVCTLHGDVWRVSGVDDALRRLTWRRMATGLHQPLGLKIVDDQVYVLGRDQITRLIDNDNNGETDFYECFTNAMRTSTGGHDYAGCLETDSRGNFYFISAPEGVVRVSPEGKQLASIASGFRNPIGLSVGPNDTITAAPQEGDWTPASAVFEVREGGYYGYGGPRVSDARPLGYDPPLCWIPRLIDNSSGGQVWATGERWGPLDGQLFTLSFGRCWMLQTLRENVSGVAQGGTLQWPLSFESGVMRGRFSPHDGQLYVSGLKGWVSSAARDGCLQRVRYTGGKVSLPVAAKTFANGIELTFSEPIERELAEDAGNYAAQAWNYRYGGQYGSPEYTADAQTEGRDDWRIASATLSANGRRVFLELPDLRPVMQLAISWRLRAVGGEPLDQTLNYTINAVGKERGEPGPAARKPRPGALASEVRERLVPGIKWSIAPVASTVDKSFVDAQVLPLAALYAADRRTISPRLAAGKFRAHGDAWLRASLNGDAAFQLRGTGAATLRINGKLAAALGSNNREPLAPVRLRQGFNRIEIDYRSPPTGDAALRLYWRGESFPWETVPPTLLVADPLDEVLSNADQFRAGRELFATRRCANCHELPRAVASSRDTMPELQADAPHLSHAGDRLSRAWTYRWLLDPRALRNHVAMPRLFDASSADDRQAAADLAEFLASDRGDVAAASTEGSEERGLELYESLGCIQCHRFSPPAEQDSFDRISLHFAAAKYPSAAALSEFLQSPRQHYQWTRMPDFSLSEQEARDLAQLVRSRSVGTCEASQELESADAKRGERLFVERGCQQCHAMRPDDSSTPPPRLASVFGRQSSAGCLGKDETARGKSPDFALDEAQRAALVAFCHSSGESLAQDSAAAGAQRLVGTLRCSACHVREQRNRVLDAESELGVAPELLPSLTWAGEKLHSDWTADQIAGRLTYRARPWLAARMPSFGPYAEPIAVGLAASHGLGTSRCVADASTPANRNLASIGQRLTQKEGGLDCRLCHALGEENLRLDNRAQGIGFSFASERLRPEFYDRWMFDPTRIDPQTAMPRFSPNGVSTKISEVLDGDARQQFKAIWSYLQTVNSNRER